jgi:mono/diheme cytochrome c family protein
MNRNWLELVFPAAMALLVVTIGVFILSMTGLLHEETPSLANDVVEPTEAPLAVDSATATVPLPPGADPAAIAAGDALFKGNCAQCHAMYDVVVGPALAGVGRRRPESWLIPWIRNSSKVVSSGDEYAVKIFSQYQKQQMPSFQLSDEEIRQILLYLKGQDSYAVAGRSALVVVD